MFQHTCGSSKQDHGVTTSPSYPSDDMMIALATKPLNNGKAEIDMAPIIQNTIVAGCSTVKPRPAHSPGRRANTIKHSPIDMNSSDL